MSATSWDAKSPRQRAGRLAGRSLLVLLVAGFHAVAATAQQPDDLPLDVVARLDLEDLMGIEVEVTTVAGVPRGVFQTPSAISVLTPTEVLRGGDLTLPGSLRLATGVLAARTYSHSWRIGARGFSGGLANKNLVLIDGRNAWDPLFGGVFWDAHDVLVADLDRIEVIRGPGPTLWGANAMNSVVNVITRSARDTQGWYLSIGAGDYARRFGSVRYGGQLADNVWYRAYAKYVDFDSLVDADGQSTLDDWSMLRGGVRLDAVLDGRLNLTLQAEGHRSLDMGEVVNVPVVPGAAEPRAGDRRARGGHLLARAGRTDTSGDGWVLQAYYDGSLREQAAGFEVRRHTGDLDFRHFFGWGGGNQLIWGLGYHLTDDRTEAGPTVRFDPPGRTLQTVSGFAQNTFELDRDRWYAMLGSKFEHNDYTGFELQPAARLWHVPSERHMLWAAFSHPVRIPTRTENDAFLTLGLAPPAAPGGAFVPLGVRGGGDLRAERMTAYEVGHRYRPRASLTLETALFFHDYSRLIYVSEPIIGEAFHNRGRGNAHGVEVELSWRIDPRWRIVGGYAHTRVHVSSRVAQQEEGLHPRHLAQLRSLFDLTPDLELNAVLQYTDDIPEADVPDYVRLDAGVTWRPTRRLEFSLWGQNLLHASHPEATFREFERSFYLRGALRY